MPIRIKKSAEELRNDSLSLGEVMLRPGVKFTFGGSLHTIVEEVEVEGKMDQVPEGSDRPLKRWLCAPAEIANKKRKKSKSDFKILPTNIIMDVHVP